MRKSRCVAAAWTSNDVTEKRTAPPAGSAGEAVATESAKASVCCRPNLGLTADDPRVGEAPVLRRGDHRTGERARSEPAPHSGSVQSCDGHPRPAGAGGRDGRACRVRGGRNRRAAGPRAQVQWRRPHDAEARHQTWCMWTDDRLNHGVAPRKTKDRKDKSRRRHFYESCDSCGAHRVQLRGSHRKRRDATPCP